MKCAKIKVELEMTVPYKDWTDDQIEFDVNENRCIATGPVGVFMDQLIAWHDARSTCWGCAIQKSMDLVEIVELSQEEMDEKIPWMSFDGVENQPEKERKQDER